jgi:hypothetical protein
MVRLPTARGDWRLVGRTVRLVLGSPVYAAVALLLAALALTVFSLSQNLSVVSFALSGSVSGGSAVRILLDQYPVLGPRYDLVTGSILLVIAGLVGVNLALVAYHVREHGLSAEGGGGSAVGVFLGLLGAGCAACGSAILAGLLSLLGVAGLGTVLPFEGLEFSAVAVVVLVLSTYWLAEGMRGGEIRGCPVDPA